MNLEPRTSNPENASGSARQTERKYDLEERLLEFASAVIDLSEKLPSCWAGNHIAGQLLRAGTSPYGNHGEAQSAEQGSRFRVQGSSVPTV